MGLVIIRLIFGRVRIKEHMKYRNIMDMIGINSINNGESIVLRGLSFFKISL
jgi:hypothetical protein